MEIDIDHDRAPLSTQGTRMGAERAGGVAYEAGGTDDRKTGSGRSTSHSASYGAGSVGL